MRTHVFVLLAVLALIAAGCEAEDVSAPETDTPDTTPSESSADPSDEPSDVPSESEEPTADAKSAFEEFFSARSTGEWTVSYTMTTTGLPHDVGSTTMTQYFGGVDRLRTDATAMGIETRTYIVDGEITICTQMGGEWMCFGSDVEADPHAEVEAEIEEGNYVATPAGSRTIAGVSATCFTFTTDEGGSGEYCFSPEGVPLFIEAGADGMSVELEATSYSLSVPAGTWDVPESTGFPGGFDPSDWI